MGIFVLIMFSARISGSHYNPIITFSYMIGNVRQGRFDRILGLFYIAAQFLGAFVGALFCAVMFSSIDDENKVKLQVEGGMGNAFLGETLGAFLMVFMYLCSTEEKTKFTRDSAV